jgi:hypothetical protein
MGQRHLGIEDENEDENENENENEKATIAFSTTPASS